MRARAEDQPRPPRTEGHPDPASQLNQARRIRCRGAARMHRPGHRRAARRPPTRCRRRMTWWPKRGNEDGSDSPGVTGKTYGGKASAAYVVRKRTALRRETAKAAPKTGDALRDWITGASALGDWAGRRRPLENRGITLSGFSATAVLGNATGGARRSWTAANSTLIALDVDFDKLTAWHGFPDPREGLVGGRQRPIGRRPDRQPVQCRQHIHAERLLSRAALRRAAPVRRETGAADRAACERQQLRKPAGRGYYVSAAFNAVPFSLPTNTLPFTSPPASQWGAVATAAPRAEIELTAGAYNADRRSSELNGTHGVDSGLDLERGVMAIGQAVVSTRAGQGRSCLPGIYSIGGFHAGDRYRRSTAAAIRTATSASMRWGSS